MEKLPFEISIKIFCLLSARELCEATCVDQYWNVIASSVLYKYPLLHTRRQLLTFAQITEKAQSHVHYLDLTRVHEHVTDKLFLCLQHLTHLKHINLSKCIYLTPAAIYPMIQANAYQLHTLILASCTISNDILHWIGKATRHHLQFLDLSNTMIKPCVSIDTANHLDSMFDTTTIIKANLRHLDLSYCTWVNGHTVENIAKCLPSLEHIILQWCNQIKLKSIDILVQKLGSLDTIDIRHIETIANAAQAFSIMENALSLKKILYTYKTVSTEIVS
ncbi:hypothetical protein HMPREF1544_00601 [Mucor circinelloides 1006PhL]|uniref:F-box domain-containing protein n=1 Tax=Mucor circinelloides f. circinelloides (strain 1006PhL) TaxID=1220926 RepID=S2KAT8_MUCC1|nr:hypothetical protein HMPREF1544_00601 [Mucor circinelloides 1006PhL]KAG1122191.1 hypothetical protein G6F42_011714 [Rhizopus arrhizus]